jgi:hypothetical protein
MATRRVATDGLAECLQALRAQHTDVTRPIIADARAAFPHLTRPQIEGALNRLRFAGAPPAAPPAAAPSDEAPAVAEWQARREAAEREARETARHQDRSAEERERFRPVDLPPVDRPKVKVRPNNYVVVSSDHHWQSADPRVESIILQAIHALRPREYILNGDGPDLLALSKYPKDARRGRSWELRDEQLGAKSWWRAVAQAGAAWDIRLTETDANHSGAGRASRWTRWLNDNAAPLFGLDGFEDDLSYGRYFHPADVRVDQVDERVLPGALRVRHGEVVRKHGGYSARAHGDKWHASVMHGHTHRVGASVKRLPGIPGVRPDGLLKTYETGCACVIDDVHGYAAGADWAQGFAIVAVDDANDMHGVELVTVEHGVAVCTTLGVTLKAE